MPKGAKDAKGKRQSGGLFGWRSQGAAVLCSAIVIGLYTIQTDTTVQPAAQKKETSSAEWLRNYEAQLTDPKEAELIKALKARDFVSIKDLCAKGQVPSQQTVYGVPILNYVGGHVVHGGDQVLELLMCLIDSGVALQASSSIMPKAGEPNEVRLTRHFPFLLQSLYYGQDGGTNDLVMALINSLLRNGADLTSTFRLSGGVYDCGESPNKVSSDGDAWHESNITALHAVFTLGSNSATGAITRLFAPQRQRGEQFGVLGGRARAAAKQLEHVARDGPRDYQVMLDSFDWSRVHSALSRIEAGTKSPGEHTTQHQQDIQTIVNMEVAVLLLLLLKGGSSQVQNLQGNLLRDFNGRTPLHYAVEAGNLLGVRMLLIAIPSLLNVRDNAQWTATDLALLRGRDAPLDALLTFEANEVSDTDIATLRTQHEATVDALLNRTSATSQPPQPNTNTNADGGGWDTSVQEEMVIPNCDIEERWDNVSAAEFYANYLLPGNVYRQSYCMSSFNVELA
jgi:hypothetical protein